MTDDATSEGTVRRFWETIDSQQWDDLRDVLAPSLRVWYAHTGETFGRDEFVRLNREYPGSWRAEILDLIGSGQRCVTHVRVSDGDDVFHVASFATTEHSRVTDLSEIWTSSDAQPPEGRRPGP